MEKKCDAGLVELKNALKREIDDEVSTVSRYKEIGAKLSITYGRDQMGETLKRMADDEYEHFLQIMSIVEILEEECSKVFPGK